MFTVAVSVTPPEVTVYTVLVEGDDMTEPVADETRSILDGHIVLSRKLGAANHYPAIDVLASASRVMNALITPQHRQNAGTIRELMAKYQDIELLLKVGEYKRGSDKIADIAIDKHDAIRDFLRQNTDEQIGWEETLHQLKSLAA
jgi:ATP synthase in type III secretion protein N